MTGKLLSTDDFRAAAKDGQRTDGTVFRFTTTEPELRDATTRKMRFVFSDATVDHSGDTIDPKGWDLSIFKRNPVALFSHMSWEPPIGRASNVSVRDGQLVGDIEFAGPDVYEFADTIYRLVKGKFLNAVSVGFKPVDWAFSQDKTRPNGINFKKQTLLEISICPVPCNPNALSEARSLGVDTRPLKAWAERVLESGDTGAVPRRQLEALRGQAGEAARRTVRSASQSGHHSAIHQAMNDIGASIEAHRTTLATLREVERALSQTGGEPDGDELDVTAVGHGVAQVAGAIACQERAVACLKGAMSAAPSPPEQAPGEPGARSAAQRLREVAEFRRSAGAQTPQERIQEVEAIKRGSATAAQTRAGRLIEARDIQRRLETEGLI